MDENTSLGAAHRMAIDYAERQRNTTTGRMLEMAQRLSRTPDLTFLRELPLPPPRIPNLREHLQNALHPLPEGQSENFVRIILERVRTLEANLQEGECLCVYCSDGTRRILVKEFRFPTWNIGILTGCDEHENPTELISHITGIQVTCQVIKAPLKRPPIGFYVPADQLAEGE